MTDIQHLEPSRGSAEPLAPEDADKNVLIVAYIVYPGSRVSDILIGGEKFQIGNAALRHAVRQADQWCDLNVDGG